MPTAPKPSTVAGSTSLQSHDEGRRTPPPITPHGLNPRSCVTCRRRKIRCDKTNPCACCSKARVQCVFPGPGRAPRRPRNDGKPLSDREAELINRLRKLEGVVRDLSGQSDDKNTNTSPFAGSVYLDQGTGNYEYGPHSGTSRATDEGRGPWKARISRAIDTSGLSQSDSDVEQGLGKLVLDEGNLRYVSDPFWSGLLEEVQEIRGMIDADSETEDEDGKPDMSTSMVKPLDHQSFIFGYNSSDIDLKPLHPLPSQIPGYWKAFLENVDPLVKIIHRPTMDRVIREVQADMNSLSRSTEALMFSIYFATIVSMTEEGVRTMSGVPKDYLLRQYRFGVEQALARARLVNTEEIVTIQAFVLFLVCVRGDDDTRFVWTMTGLAMRIAQCLGLHRDGTKFGLSPFDTEMRRRLWWQIVIIDTRASEDHGSEPLIFNQRFDTKFPLSVNDEDLDPDAKQPPKPRKGTSEMTFVLIRYELCSLTRCLSFMSGGETTDEQVVSLEEKEQLLRSTTERLENTYLQYCNNGQPLYLLAISLTRMILAKITLIIYSPLTQPGKDSSLPQTTKDRLFITAIELLECSKRDEREASTAKWGWLWRTYVQWNAIGYVLGELAVRPPSDAFDRAWKTIDSHLVDWVGSIDKKGLWQPMRILLARARRVREQYIKTGLTARGDLAIDRKLHTGPLKSSDLAYIESQVPSFKQSGDIPDGMYWTEPLTQNSMKDGQNIVHDVVPDSQLGYPSGLVSPVSMMPQTLPPDQQLNSIDYMGIPSQTIGDMGVWFGDNALVPDYDSNALQNGHVNWQAWNDLMKNYGANGQPSPIASEERHPTQPI